MRRLEAIRIVDPPGVKRKPEIEREIETAIADIIANNVFDPVLIADDGPYVLTIRPVEQNLEFILSNAAGGAELGGITLGMRDLRRIVRDYFMICDGYAKALSGGNMMQIETLDMARRGVHDEGGVQLANLLHGKVSSDLKTARRLFTLVCALQIGINHGIHS